MPTMSHTKEQRKEWHAGKVDSGVESRARRVDKAINRGKNRGAHTPTFLRRGPYYAGMHVRYGESARMCYLRNVHG